MIWGYGNIKKVILYMFKRLISFFLAVISMLALCACEAGESSRRVFVMDTVCEISVYPKNDAAVDEMCSLLYELDDELSSYSGKVLDINEGAGGKGSSHILNLLTRSMEFYDKTGGAFSPSLGTVIDLWGVGGKNYVPRDDEIQSSLEAADIENVERSGDEVVLRNGVKLNFGAVAKGYASDVIKEMIVNNPVESAVVSLGGNVYVHGTKPDGSLWNVAIRDPKGGESDWLGSLALTDSFVISSGDYERYFERDGKRYHHIIDPKTGSPAESDLLAAAVVCRDGTLGDAYSTALYVMGRENALSFWREEKGFELVLVGRDGRVTVTEGIADVFAPNQERGYTYETAYR